MDGKPLYEYAREGIPLPRPIEKRAVTVHSLELIDWKGSDHTFRYPERKFTEEQKKNVEKAMHGIEDQVRVDDQPEEAVGEGEGKEEGEAEAPVACVLRMKVSGGTYVRSIVHDLGHAVDSAAHGVTLTRSRQGRLALEPEALPEPSPSGTEPAEGGAAVEERERDMGCVPWSVIEKALEDPGEKDEEGWTEWERVVLDNLEVVEPPAGGHNVSRKG